ncbi:putative metalloprotease CJM1_0395 family protein [Propionivibrio sp.]|uniref:putative metalloprotease CJM1_0395 family protein n=1 Tax=Propionivibrio sp. TaxID=2212460 RepID=UPI003BF38BA1
MIQSTAGISTQAGYGFEKSAPNGGQASKSMSPVSRSGDSTSNSDSNSISSVNQLTPEQQQQVQQLKQTDRMVRAHEQAHLAVGSDLVRGGATFSYQTGPDNQRYAVGGEVSIDTSSGRTPEETIPKAQHIRAAAMAPADPSAQDQSVAAKASSMESNARIELAVQQRETAASAEQGSSTRLYRGVEQGNGRNAQVGASLDIYA